MTEAAAVWLVIPRWDEHQHRDSGRTFVPAWIKTHTRLLHDDAYLDLTAHQRAVLHGLWLIYASHRRQVAVNTASLSRALNLRVSSRQLEALNHAGFIEFSASKPASEPDSKVASLELEKRREPLTPSGGTSRATGTNARTQGTNPRAPIVRAREILEQHDLERALDFIAGLRKLSSGEREELGAQLERAQLEREAAAGSRARSPLPEELDAA